MLFYKLILLEPMVNTTNIVHILFIYNYRILGFRKPPRIYKYQDSIFFTFTLGAFRQVSSSSGKR